MVHRPVTDSFVTALFLSSASEKNIYFAAWRGIQLTAQHEKNMKHVISSQTISDRCLAADLLLPWRVCSWIVKEQVNLGPTEDVYDSQPCVSNDCHKHAFEFQQAARVIQLVACSL